MIFGEVLRQLMDDRDITQKKLADDLNIAPSTIENYVRGLREPDFQILKLLAKHFGVTTDYLLDVEAPVKLSRDEEEIIHIFRALPANKKMLLLSKKSYF